MFATQELLGYAVTVLDAVRDGSLSARSPQVGAVGSLLRESVSGISATDISRYVAQLARGNEASAKPLGELVRRLIDARSSALRLPAGMWE